MRLGAPLLVAGTAILLGAAIWVGDPTTPNGVLPPCPIKALLGIDCPGCGSMRMLYSLMHGNVWAAVRFNALGVVAVVLLVWAYLAWTYGRVVGRRITSWQHSRWAALVALVLWVVWLVVRNLPFAPFTALFV
ncbi:membrane protein [Mycobacterium bourgelatii]|uniref:Membrane protein n=2 Tax=Mycobacterium bourgelatii TaxID=1273442 RepID=A0A7I9YI68_MYCBU|nr:membrane protein [Mycobacterium bourgelatii]